MEEATLEELEALWRATKASEPGGQALGPEDGE
jgi:hypothetical protein